MLESSRSVEITTGPAFTSMKRNRRSLRKDWEREGKVEYCSDEIFVVEIKVVTVVVGLGVHVAGREHECFGGVYKDDLRWNETKEGTVGGKFGSEEYVEVRRSTTGSDLNQKEQYHSRTFG